MTTPSPDPVDIIVLAAGRGRRLGDAGDDRPKWLLDVGGRTIADRHLEAFSELSARRNGRLRTVAVVTGHRADLVESHAGDAVRLVHNPDYLVRNNWYSLLVGLRALPDRRSRVVVVNGDLCAPVPWVVAFLEASADTDEQGLLAIDFDRRLTDESMKVSSDGDRLALIGKHDFAGAIGEYVGMLMATGDVLDRVWTQLEAFENDAATANEWYEGAVGRVAAAGARWGLWATPSSGWVEIDDEVDLAQAQELGVG